MIRITTPDGDRERTQASSWLARAHQVLANDSRQTRRAPERLFHLALNDAAALAWQTPFPHLVLPTLAEEKLSALERWAAKQRHLRHGSLLGQGHRAWGSGALDHPEPGPR